MRKFWGALSIINVILLILWMVFALLGTFDQVGLFKYAVYVLVPNSFFCLWQFLETEK
jgi:hypothetical protein